MPETNAVDFELLLIIGALVLLYLILFLGKGITYFTEFRDELRYLNDEIKRATGAERASWQRKKRRLWLSLIPFVRYR